MEVQHTTRTVPPRQGGGTVVLLLLLALVSTFVLISARRSLQNGVDALAAAQSQVQTLGSGMPLHVQLGAARGSVVQARDDFRSADNRLAPLAPLFERLSWVPEVGVEIAAAPHIAHAALGTTKGALSLLDGVDPLATRLDGPAPGKTAPMLVQALAAGQPHFNGACSEFGDAERSRRQIPVGPIPPRLRPRSTRLTAGCRGSSSCAAPWRSLPASWAPAARRRTWSSIRTRTSSAPPEDSSEAPAC